MPARLATRIRRHLPTLHALGARLRSASAALLLLAVMLGTRADDARAQAVAATVRYDSLGVLRGLNGTGVGALNGTLLALPDRPGLNTQLALFCVDMLNGEVAGMAYEAFLTPLDGSAPLELSTRQGALVSDALLRYRKVAWLTERFAAFPEQAGGLQGAIWSLFTPLQSPYLPNADEATQLAFWLGAADAFAASDDFATYDWSRFVLVTDVRGVGTSPGGTQEFLTTIPPITTVPEPASLALVGGGLVALVAVARRRRAAIGA